MVAWGAPSPDPAEQRKYESRGPGLGDESQREGGHSPCADRIDGLPEPPWLPS